MRFLKSFITFSISRIGRLVFNSEHSKSVVVSPPSIYEMLVTVSREAQKERALDLLYFLDAKYKNYTKFLNRYDSLIDEDDQVFKINDLIFYREPVNIGFVSKFDCSCVIKKELLESLYEIKNKRKFNKEIAFITEGVAIDETSKIKEDFSVSLLNTIHFDCDWSKKFNKSHTKLGLFNGNIVNMMHQTNSFKASVSRSDYKAVVLPYEGTNHMFVAVLPRTKTDFEKIQYNFAMNKSLNELMNECTETNIDLSMPIFNIETDIDLSNNLDKLGIDFLFKKTKFNGIAADLEIDKIRMRQKICMSFNENGTYSKDFRHYENFPCDLIPESDVVELKFDKPFLFFIVETIIDERLKNYVPLFIGSYMG